MTRSVIGANMLQPLYQAIASAVDARLRCIHNYETAQTQADREHWDAMVRQWTASLDLSNKESLPKRHLPSGAGFDDGTQIDLEVSTPDKIVMRTMFHHMNDGGYYDGWTIHKVTVTPSLIHRITLDVDGKDRAQIKDLIHDVFHNALMGEVDA